MILAALQNKNPKFAKVNKLRDLQNLKLSNMILIRNTIQ